MDYTKFYTPHKIADILIKQIEGGSFEKVIDICCGSCNLLFAAKKRWKQLQMTGVDVIKNTNPDVEFYCDDGRNFALKSKRLYPLVLANPPFAYLKKKHEFPSLYYEWLGNYCSSRLEIEMLFANLHLLSDNGVLMIIMPSTFVESQTNRKIRKLLAKSLYIQKIVSLPLETFKKSNIKSYALFIKKLKPKRTVTRFYSIKLKLNEYSISKSEIIPQEFIRNGKWDTLEEIIPSIKLDIKRGNISSNMFSIKGYSVLHTAKKQANWVPTVRSTSFIPENAVYAEEGDIIVSRIGKSVGEWSIHYGERAAISDCLFCIKDNESTIYSNIIESKYNYIIRGVATKYITMKDFTIWYQSLLNHSKIL